MTRIKLRAAIAACLIALGSLHTTCAATLEWMHTLGTSQEDVSYGNRGRWISQPLHYRHDDRQSWRAESLKEGRICQLTGALRWTTQFGTTADDFGFGVASDRSGNVFVAGQSNERDSATGSTIHAFVTSVDSNGKVRWSKDFRTPTYGSVEAHSVVTDGFGSVYVTGRILSATLGTRLWDIFVSKFNSDGSLNWTRMVGNGYSDAGTSISMNGAGSLYVGGVVLDLGGW